MEFMIYDHWGQVVVGGGQCHWLTPHFGCNDLTMRMTRAKHDRRPAGQPHSRGGRNFIMPSETSVGARSNRLRPII